jgi:selenocysteine lyase/cysteine desulfurase
MNRESTMKPFRVYGDCIKYADDEVVSMVSIEKIRSDFPALREWTYLDNAFVGLMPRQVREGYDRWADQWYNFDVGNRTILSGWLEAANHVRSMMADFIGVESKEIAYTMCTGSGLNIVINGTLWRRGDNVVFAEWEHNPLDTYTTRRNSVQPRVWKPDDGRFLTSDLEKLVDERTRLVQVSQVSYVNGFRADLREIAEVAHANGAKLLVDATQAVGALRVDYKKDGADYVAFAPYKYLMGPAGLAFLYVNEELISELIPDRTGWKNQIWEGAHAEDKTPDDAAEKFEYGTINFQGVYAMEESLKYLNQLGMEYVEKRVLDTTEYFYEQLEELGKEIWTPKGNESPVVSYNQAGAVELAENLKRMRIKVTGREAHGGHIRVAAHFYNTREDVDKLIEAIK